MATTVAVIASSRLADTLSAKIDLSDVADSGGCKRTYTTTAQDHN
jgi:hypothetical protein